MNNDLEIVNRYISIHILTQPFGQRFSLRVKVINQEYMKRTIFALVLILLFSVGCTEKDKVAQPVNHVGNNMKIIPDSPGSKDLVKLVIYDDCTYNTLSKNKRTGNTIDIEKQFNSMMKWPCMMKNDTILIGILPQGTYNVNYTLIDISQQAPQNITYSNTFQLKVSM